MRLFRDNGKENGDCYIVLGYTLGLYGENGKENGSYYLGFRVAGFLGLKGYSSGLRLGA